MCSYCATHNLYSKNPIKTLVIAVHKTSLISSVIFQVRRKFLLLHS